MMWRINRTGNAGEAGEPMTSFPNWRRGWDSFIPSEVEGNPELNLPFCFYSSALSALLFFWHFRYYRVSHYTQDVPVVLKQYISLLVHYYAYRASSLNHLLFPNITIGLYIL